MVLSVQNRTFAAKIELFLMANPYFEFKRFTVFHDRCAMKVGTDGVLLGSWMDVEGARHLLDIGCGCGLIALMAAQRCSGSIVAVELDPEAALQAGENVGRSPWADRVEVVCADIRSYAPGQKFDRVFSNPPYFVDSLKCPDKKRSSARHVGEGLGFDELFDSVVRLLDVEGEFSLVLPADLCSEVKAVAASHLLYLSRETQVCTRQGKAPKRVLLAFRFVPPAERVVPQLLVLETAPRIPSEAFRRLVNDFYLK